MTTQPTPAPSQTASAGSVRSDSAFRAFLRARYPDYSGPRHDAFVIRYQQEQDKEGARAWFAKRGIILGEEGNSHE